MTDVAKAIAFATHCLNWTDVSLARYTDRICDGGSERDFDPGSAADLETVLQEFLGNRYFIQVNRGTTSLFHWRVIVGLQDLSIKGACPDHAIGVGEDLWDAIFDACVQAAGMDHPEK